VRFESGIANPLPANGKAWIAEASESGRSAI
jgi:hypothetical protein